MKINIKNKKNKKNDKFSKIPKNNNYFTCLLSFRILVNLPNFERLSHLNELDLCGLFKLNNGLGKVVIQF